MAHPTLEYIRGLRKSLEEKKAEIVGQDPSTMPGAEHDSKVPESYKKPDEETKDETMVPNSGLSTAGAGDDSPITHTNDLEADEPALTPDKKPMISADANAKTAEALAAEILTGVNAWYQKKAEDPESLITDDGTEPEQTKDAIPPKKEPEITDEADKAPTGEGAEGETAAASKEDAKTAGALDMELTSDVLAKIAAIILSTEEGTKMAEDVLGKAAGAEAAAQTIGFLRAQSDLAQKQAEYMAGQRDAEMAIMKMAQDAAIEEAAAAADDGDIPADISVDEVADTLDEMVESGEISEDEADQVVADLAQALVGGGEKEAQAIDPAAAEAAMNEQVAVPPAQFDPASIPQDDMSDITPDDIADAIDGMVESGEISEDEADQVVADIVQSAQADDQQISPEEVATTIQEMVQSGELPAEAVPEILGALEGVPAPEADAAAPAEPAAPAGDAMAADAAKTAAASLMGRIMANRRAR